jgi:bisphosphoglycerate-independent phosphoglycerate mutase (AlkP superfamily)
MFDIQPEACPNWEALDARPTPKTSHTLSPVPLYLYDPDGVSHYRLRQSETFTLANIANTVLSLLGVALCEQYQPSIIDRA